MGQSNENENPELILEKLKSLTIQDENKTSLEKSFHYIRNILNDYKFYKDILENNNNNNRKTISFIPKHKFSSSHEYSKSELIQYNGIYDKNILQDVAHTIERIKKWVKMSKNPYSSNDDKSLSKNNNESSDILEDNLNIIINNNDNMSRDNKHFKSSNNIRKVKNKNNKKIILSNYTDKKIENGITKFGQNQKQKFIERIKKGPPDCFRWASWCIINNLPLDRDNTIYENYTNMVLEKENKDRIIRDIERTFSDKNIEKEELRRMETSLYKVLKSFWNLDKEIGYCQGMNLLVGFLLILSDFNERDTFYLLTSNFSDTFKLRKKYEYNFRGLFIEEFPLLYFMNYIFESLLEQYVNDLKNHLENLGISIDLWMGKWFQTVFTIILPINWCKRLWDNIFADNIFFIVKFGIAFTIMIKDELLKMDEEIQILNYFKNFEKYALCYDNDLLNEKCDVYSIILKSKKIKIDIDYYLKNYEKNEENGKGFFNKMAKIQYIKYQFYEQLVAKPTLQTILFSDDDNNNNKDINNLITDKNNENININNIIDNYNKNENYEKIFFNDEDKKEIENRFSLKNNNKPINLKNGLNRRNKTINNENIIKKILSNDIDNNKNFLTERDNNNQIISNNNNINNNNNNINNNNINNININDNDSENVINNNNNNNGQINNNGNITDESINNSYYQNVNENIFIDNISNIIKNNLDTHQLNKFINNNKLNELTSNNYINNVFTKSSDIDCISPKQKEKKESVGINIPNLDDISIFIGKRKFNKSQKKILNNNNINTNTNGKFGIIYDKEKINQWC